MRLLVAQVIAKAEARPPGYLEDVLSRGKIDGEWIEFDDQTYAELIAKYRGDAGGCKGCGQ